MTVEWSSLAYTVFLALPLTVFFAGAYDLLTYKIPNYVSGILIFSFFLFAALHPEFDWRLFALHIACGVGVLIFGFLLFACNLLGGGDGKLLAAIALWMGPHDVIEFMAITGVAGGIVALWVVFLRSSFLAYLFYNVPIIKNLFFGSGKKATSFPYGIAIAFALYCFLPEARIYSMSV